MIDLATLVLDRGAHDVCEDGACLMEARSAAWSAARSALQPTVDALQTSAIQLYAAMINPSAVTA